MARLKANIAAGDVNGSSSENVQVKELEKQYNIKNIEIGDVEIDASAAPDAEPSVTVEQ